MSIRHSVAVVGVIVDEQGRVLVAARADGTRWEPPGGVLELSEAIVYGLKREILEETGYHIEPERLVSVQKNLTKGVVALVFRGHVTGGELRTSSETPRVEWWTREQVVSGMPAPYAQRILDALDDRALPTVREHNGERLLNLSPSFADDPATTDPA